MPQIHPTAIVETDAIAADASIDEFAVVRSGVVLGPGVKIAPRVLIEENIEVGANVEILAGSLLGRRPRAVGAVAREPTFEERLVVGDGCIVGPNAVIYYDVELDDEVLVADGVSIRELSRVGARSVLGRGVTLDRDVNIGVDSRVMDKAHLTGGMRVGDKVFISTLVATTNDSTFGQHYVEDTVKGPIVESEAMIGGGASLLPGVRVGRRATVGSGAVVTADVPPDTLVLGVPARPVNR